MKRSFILFVFSAFLLVQLSGQKSSFMILGDMHYDLLEDHDMNWLSTKPGDLRQVTEEYTVFTRENWIDFMAVLKARVESEIPTLRAVVQLGDLSEGLAGSEEKARQMASNTMKAIEAAGMPAPWILTKGNHDITGPGAKDAFQEYYVPMIRKQTGDPSIAGASYSYTFGNVQICCLDPWDEETDMLAFLESELGKSGAKYKFVAIHEPVIPVTERCWHVLRKDDEKREKLLELIARNKAIVLCGHLHRYSVVRRSTPFGPIVQLMAISVVKDRAYQHPSRVLTEYGPSLAEDIPQWQPETLDERIAILKEEAKYVDYYKQCDLPGYALIKIDEVKESIMLEYYAAFGDEPYDIIDLSALIRH